MSGTRAGTGPSPAAWPREEGKGAVEQGACLGVLGRALHHAASQPPPASVRTAPASLRQEPDLPAGAAGRSF